MNNAIKSAKLDYSLVTPYMKIICLTMLLPIAFTAVNRSLIIGISFTACVIAMTAGYTFSVSEKNGMERLYGILPVSVKSMVIGRYLFVAGLGISALIFSLITNTIVLTLLGDVVTVSEMITAAITGFLCFTLYTVFQLPGYYRFGAIKGRIFMYVPVLGLLLISMLNGKVNLADIPFLAAIINSPVLSFLGAGVIVVLVYVISIGVSTKILKKKQ